MTYFAGGTDRFDIGFIDGVVSIYRGRRYFITNAFVHLSMREVQFNNIVAIRALLFLYFHLNSLLAYYICTDFSNGRCPALSRLLLLTTRHLLSWIYLVYLVDFVHTKPFYVIEGQRI